MRKYEEYLKEGKKQLEYPKFEIGDLAYYDNGGNGYGKTNPFIVTSVSNNNITTIDTNKYIQNWYIDGFVKKLEYSETNKKHKLLREISDRIKKFANLKKGDYIIIDASKYAGNKKDGIDYTKLLCKVESLRYKGDNQLGVIFDFTDNWMHNLQNEIKAALGYFIYIIDITDIVDNDDPRVSEFERKYKELINKIPKKGDYYTVEYDVYDYDYIHGQNVKQKTVNFVGKIIRIYNGQYQVELSSAIDISNNNYPNQFATVLNVGLDSLKTKLKKGDSLIKKYEEEKKISSELTKGSFIELNGELKIWNNDGGGGVKKISLDKLIARVVWYPENMPNNLNMQVDFGSPVKDLPTNNLGNRLRLSTGYQLFTPQIKEIITSQEDPRVKDFLLRRKKFISEQPREGDLVEIVPFGNKMGILKLRENNIDRIMALQYIDQNDLYNFNNGGDDDEYYDDDGNPIENESEYDDYGDLDDYMPKRKIIALAIGMIRKAPDNHPFVKAYRNGDIQKMKMSPRIKDLIPKFLEEIYTDISYIDVGKSIDDISFIALKKAKNIPEEERWTSNLRQSTKIGRFINKICDGIKMPMVEQIVIHYKALYKMRILKENPFEFVEGEDIRYWYSEERYVKGGGTLNNSCMRGAGEQLQLYVDNPDKIRLMIIKTQDGKNLLGRSLIWKLDQPEGQYYMDRVYTVNNYDEKLYYEFAKMSKWLSYTDGKMKKMMVKLKNKKYNQLPYLDTMRFNKKNGVITNYEGSSGYQDD